MRKHVYDGERCIHCGVNVYDCDCENDECCNDREPTVYTTESVGMPMQKYRKKPMDVEAVLFKGSPTQRTALLAWMHGEEYVDPVMHTNDMVSMEIRTPEGTWTIHAGWYIVKGPKGEFWPVRKDIFEETYEASNGD